ncbi:TPA: fimbrial protein [Proteus mirabilis]|uniref:fimbrial protein n=1 Tax=Proteus mirabilis TaxID=584 RepID=UPI000F897CB8|nr:DUF1120 domain-containing protein [Proteus mirabilis]RUL10607.1 type 1 fimbrial protein [Proteus mirabilis]HAU5528795.1 DUF1120 domain-containing protein [Proteus mirabilis]HAU5536008.1 DUF1120 domain-containing protein [Proteus mirabilis]HAU5539589.1 DUF1120 domain-containing protein [Proteus mirabilis]HAU5543082.1 DUF1120 domain-containing protein [Proteus mirabilis]
MKKVLLSLTMLAIMSTPVLAKSPVANLKINGDIKPPTCTINGEENDIFIDYGKISPSLIPENSNYALGSRENDMVISCDAITYLTFTVSDTYTSNKAPAWHNGIFGLVNAENPTQEVGGILLFIKDMKVDNKPVYAGRVDSKESTWRTEIIVKDTLTGWTTEAQISTSKDNLKLAQGKIFSATLQAGKSDADKPNYGYILSRKALSEDKIDLTNGLDYIGEAVFTFNFGV